MNETELILFVGELMYENKIITDIGLKILHNDFLSDIAVPIEPNELKKATRVSIFMCVVYNMTLLYGGYCTEHNLPMDHFERLKPIALHFEQSLPILLKTLSNKYLEVFHAAKVAAFVKGRSFDDYLPNHPADEKTLHEIKYTQDTEPIVLNV
jgi:hypothetical protein